MASGLYNNASEIVGEALRLMLEREGRSAPAFSEKLVLPFAGLRSGLLLLEPQLRGRGVTSLALFGSAARGEARTGSDIDVLIDVDSGARLSLVDLVSIKNFLEKELGCPVDVTTRDGIDPAIRNDIIKDLKPIF